jgi:hypothetical protein
MWRCPDCGFRINGGYEPGTHECDEITLFAREVRLFEPMFQAWLETNAGRFAIFFARREIGA